MRGLRGHQQTHDRAQRGAAAGRIKLSPLVRLALLRRRQRPITTPLSSPVAYTRCTPPPLARGWPRVSVPRAARCYTVALRVREKVKTTPHFLVNRCTQIPEIV